MTTVQVSLCAQLHEDKGLFHLELVGYEHGRSDYGTRDIDNLSSIEREAYRKGYSEGFSDRHF